MNEKVFYVANTLQQQVDKTVYLVKFEQFERGQVIASNEEAIEKVKRLYKSVNIDIHSMMLRTVKNTYYSSGLFDKVFGKELTKKQNDRDIGKDFDIFLKMSEVCKSYGIYFESTSGDKYINPVVNLKREDCIKKSNENEEYTYLIDFYDIPTLDTKKYHIYYTNLLNTCIVWEEFIDIKLNNLFYIGSLEIYSHNYDDMISLFHEQAFKNREEAVKFYESFKTLYNAEYDKEDRFIKHIILNYEFNESFSIEREDLLTELKKDYSKDITYDKIEVHLRRFRIHKKGTSYRGIRKKTFEVSDRNILELFEEMVESRNLKKRNQ